MLPDQAYAVQLGLGPNQGAAACVRLNQMIKLSREGSFAKTAGGIVRCAL
jgi:hypothetical protein